MSRGQATGGEIVCISFPRRGSSKPSSKAFLQPKAGNTGSNRKGRPEAAAPAPPRSGAAAQRGLLRCTPGALGPEHRVGRTPWSQRRAALRAREPHPRRRAPGYHSWIWGGGAAGRVWPEVLLGKAGVCVCVWWGCSRVGGAGGAGVNVRPARTALTQFHQKPVLGEEAANLPRTRRSRAEAGRDLRQLHPVHLHR